MRTSILQQIRYGQFNSKFLRNLLSLYFREGITYKVLLGPLRGMRLFYDRSINYHAILGLWELESYHFLNRILKKGNLLNRNAVVADVGANIGFFSLWMASRFENSKVYAFEPAPKTAKLLKKNLELNHISNVQIENLACSNEVGSTKFFIGAHHHQSSLLQEWAAGKEKQKTEEVTVRTTTLDAYFKSGLGVTPDFIKMDIEGGGAFALRGCDQCISEKRPLVWIESHRPDEDRAISDLIVKHDYQAYRLNNHRFVKDRTTTHPDPNGVWGTLLLIPQENVLRAKTILRDR